MEPPDTVLITRVLADDDRRAFAELVNRHRTMLYGFLRRLTNDAFLADDLAQEAFAEAYVNLRKFGGKSAFSTWLLGIGYNRFRHYLRKRHVWETTDENLPETADENTSAVPHDVKTDMRAAIAGLGEDQRAAIELCYGQGLSHEEAARVLNCPIGTVKTNILRAKENLKTYLAVYAVHAQRRIGNE